MYFHHLLFLWLHQHSKPFICENLKQIFLETEESGWKEESKKKKHDLFFRIKEQLRDSCSTITQSRQQSCVISAHILSCIQLLYTPPRMHTKLIYWSLFLPGQNDACKDFKSIKIKMSSVGSKSPETWYGDFKSVQLFIKKENTIFTIIPTN